MKIPPFKIERYFAQYEFDVPHLLCCSDAETLTVKELLALADKETLKLWKNLNLGYTESAGHSLLRSEISKLYKNIVPNNTLAVVPAEGITLTMNALLNKGDHVIVAYPAYQSLYTIAEHLGCETTYWKLQDKDGWNLDVGLLKQNIKGNTKLIVINFPHNPTGYLPNNGKFQEIIDIAKDNNIYIFSDEMYWLSEYDTKDRLQSACDLYENAVSLCGLSKSFGLPGLRVGWLATQNKELLKTLATYKDYSTICGSAPSEILAIVALRAKEEIIKRTLGIVKDNLAILDDFFQRHSNKFSWNKPQAGTMAFPKLLLPENIESFCLNLVKAKGVLLLPDTLFDYEGNYFRLGFGKKSMPEALNQLESHLETAS